MTGTPGITGAAVLGDDQIAALLAPWLGPDATQLDLSHVMELDTAGLQLLLTARRFASAAGRELSVTNPSRVVSDVLELCRLGALLAPPPVAAAEA